jgi:hypothetical protein
LWAWFVVALGYLFSGTFTGHAQHTSWLHAFAFVPWVLWRLDAALLGRRLLPALQAGALLGLSALAGYPAIVIQTGALAFFWTVGREVTRERDDEGPRRETAARSAGVLAMMAVVGAVVLLPSWFAFLRESRGYTDRAGPLPKEVAVHDNALHPLALTTFASTYLHVLATLYAPARRAPTDGSSAGAYAGVVTLPSPSSRSAALPAAAGSGGSPGRYCCCWRLRPTHSRCGVGFTTSFRGSASPGTAHRGRTWPSSSSRFSPFTRHRARVRLK